MENHEKLGKILDTTLENHRKDIGKVGQVGVISLAHDAVDGAQHGNLC